jgi:hypothetical protein
MPRRYDRSLVFGNDAGSGSSASADATNLKMADRTPNRVNLDLVDLLYAVPVAALATRVGETELVQVGASAWADIVLALVALTLGWVGHHTNRWRRDKDAPDPSWLHENAFTEGAFWQFWLEVFVIGAYFALSTRLSLPGHSRVSSFHWKGSWIVALFGLYVLWDAADIATTKMRAKRARRDETREADCYKSWAKRAWHGAIVTALFLLVFGAVRWRAPAGSYSTVPFDATCIVLLYAYRVAQQVWIRAFWGVSYKDGPRPTKTRLVVAAGVLACVILVIALAGAGVLSDLFSLRREPMVISHLRPSHGPATGGTPVVIDGEFFERGRTAFRVGKLNAPRVRCQSDTSCTLVTPPGPVGVAGVTASLRGDGSESSRSSEAARFTYVSPRREAVQVELTPRGRLVLRQRLGAGCRNDDLHGRLIAGPSSAPLVLSFATANCRRLRVRVTPNLGAVDASAPAQ